MIYIPESFTPSTIDPKEQLFQGYFTDYYPNSRNLRTALMPYQHYSSKRTVQYFVTALENATNTKINQLHAESVKINNGLCQANTLKQLLANHDIYTDIANAVIQTKQIKLNIIYVTSGYTFLKNYLQENNYPRYKGIENYIYTKTKDSVRNPAQYHCVITKYCKPEECIANKDIYTIILTEVNQEIIDKIIYALPLFIMPKEELDNIIPIILDETNEQEFIKDQDVPVQTKLKQLLKTYVEGMFTTLEHNPEENEIQTFYMENFKTFVEYSWQIINYKNIETIQEIFITNLQSAYQRSILGDLNNKIPDIDSRIERTLVTLNSLYAEKEKIQKRLALQNMLENDAIKNIFETLNYFKQIKIKNITNNALLLSITGPLLNYDVDTLTTFINNPHSYYNQIITDQTSRIFKIKDHTFKNVLTLIKEILLDQKYTILIQQDFKLYITDESNPDRLFDIEAIRESAYYKQLPNPHIYRYNCYGKALDIISKAFHQQDFETAFGQLVYASLQLSVEDSTVFNSFLNLLFTFPHKTIQDNSTKELYTFNELLTKLEQNGE